MPRYTPEYSREYYLKNRDKILERRHKFYLRNKEKINKKNNEYRKNHKEQYQKWQKYYRTIWYPLNRNRMCAHNKKNYLKNKSKYLSRVLTYKVFNGEPDIFYKGKRNRRAYGPIINIPKKCKKCDSKINLQIHHEIYPPKKKEIINAVNDGKIYYLCNQCHPKGRPCPHHHELVV